MGAGQDSLIREKNVGVVQFGFHSDLESEDIWISLPALQNHGPSLQQWAGL